MKPMIDHDRLFKELLTTFFWEFIELFLPEVALYLDRDSITFLDKEIFSDVTIGDRYEADIVARCQFRGQESYFLVHLEHQAQGQVHFPQRMFRYFSLLYAKYNLPVYPIALFSSTYPLALAPHHHQVAFPNKVVLQFDYDLIQLNQLNWRDFLQQENPVAAALMAKMKIEPQDRRRVKYECLRLLATLKLNPAKMKLISGFIDTYLRLNAEEARLFKADIVAMNPETQEAVMEIVTSWMEEGIQQGIQQGMQAIVQRQLLKRIGTIKPELQARISQLSSIQLEDLAEAVLDFSSAADLVAWLQGISG
jgi:hypothetical protein